MNSEQGIVNNENHNPFGNFVKCNNGVFNINELSAMQSFYPNAIIRLKNGKEIIFEPIDVKKLNGTSLKYDYFLVRHDGCISIFTREELLILAKTFNK